MDAKEARRLTDEHNKAPDYTDRVLGLVKNAAERGESQITVSLGELNQNTIKSLAELGFTLTHTTVCVPDGWGDKTTQFSVIVSW